ncbi:acetylornithine deacetylase/succinyl-diaminopimelate desuccinylase [Natrialba hulunbeirensis JCM 10989]|uniref:Acetylornithine deacetylase/succinyl-diaminopimelate desuccinylase n=1 Tax=Natrialba hulunbeirensis JCM 10989 TaxID=1227493 RepID=M0A275_9EURY|nr:M20 family metallopeptidase [Natrialba hulunbeirensis]ELY92416.1 acetylornithine deacetylase/succinyl-diaminopimelate desuccinylase [Natrialba hulunbeirensis JCM 10989]
MSPESSETKRYPTDLPSLAAALVRLESENPPGNESACAEYVHDWFTHHGIESTLIDEPDPDRQQVGARIGTGRPTLVLNGHLDVVPAGDSDEWTYPPYGGVIEDGRLYGRGSVDMKTAIASAMLTALNLRSDIENGCLDGSIVVHAAMGEETADPGTKSLLDAGFDGDVGVVLEPTQCRVATSEKGMAWYEIRWPGEPAHASDPDRGANPIDHVRPVLARLNDYDATLRERRDPLCGRAYATVTQISAGEGSNKAVLADRTAVTLDRRILPDETIDAVDDEIEQLVSELNRDHGIKATWNRNETYSSAEIPIDHPLAEIFRDHSTAVTDAPTEPWGIRASTDVREFINHADIPAITWGPGSLAQAHTVDEYIDLDEARNGLEILERAARTILSTDSFEFD